MIEKLLSLSDVIQLAKALHAAGQTWQGTAFGWPADYTPEIKEEHAVFEEYDENNMMQTVVAPHWSPASFCIGINDPWFVSLTWEFGVEEEPWLYRLYRPYRLCRYKIYGESHIRRPHERLGVDGRAESRPVCCVAPDGPRPVHRASVN